MGIMLKLKANWRDSYGVFGLIFFTGRLGSGNPSKA
jgi:hypothetical protein